MQDQETSIIEKGTSGAPKVRYAESHIGGMSLRALVVVMVMVTVCGLEVMKAIQSIQLGVGIETPKEPFYSISLVAISYFFGSKHQPQTQSQKPT